MSRDIEIKMASDNGEQFYTRAHVDGLDGFEEYYQDLLTVADNLASFQADHIQDTGWMDYDVLPTSDKNAMYAGSGFKCGIRQIHYVYGNAATGQRYVTQKMIRMNLEDFKHGDQVAQIPSGFTNHIQVFMTRSGSVRLPIMIRIYPNGKIFAYVDSADQSASNAGNRIYGQFEWTE